jgi:hypothetical protein
MAVKLRLALSGNLALLFVVLILLFGCETQEPGPDQNAKAAADRPNVLFVLADDMRADDMRYMPKTRALLGNSGVRFRSAYVSLAVCCPSRATILHPWNVCHGRWASRQLPVGGCRGARRSL